ncbi:hypothetical protein HPB48_009581 [Haemaphysalis longicornis]|uniref:Cytochrome P450 n=1 Tax=Haemaphysalis longicornis TaxID=44386 RepID=A0A9J6F6R0_HAELO|nr:hypothetical protein HPB48_009581 [Haemaphysalis longicornis]
MTGGSTVLLALTFLLVAFAAWAVRRRHKQGLLKRYGFPGPTPNLFFGNWLELKKDRIKVMEEWAQRYGRVYGYYEGEVPKVVIGDMDVIKECFIKQSHAFIDRPPMVISVEPMESCLIGLKGKIWHCSKLVQKNFWLLYSAKPKMYRYRKLRSSFSFIELHLAREHGVGDCRDVLDLRFGRRFCCLAHIFLQ